jgi:hypothetical protein
VALVQLFTDKTSDLYDQRGVSTMRDKLFGPVRLLVAVAATDSNPSLALSEVQELTDWCILGLLGLQIVVVLESGTVDNLVINLNAEKYVNITDAYK